MERPLLSTSSSFTTKIPLLPRPLPRTHLSLLTQTEFPSNTKSSMDRTNVFNLLRPGQETCLRVDFMRVVADIEGHFYVNVPVTLLSKGKEVVLMKNNHMGQIVYKTFPGIKTAVAAFVKAADEMNASRPFFPRYVHKAADRPLSLLSSSEEIGPLWRSFGITRQSLCQFLPSATRSVSLFRLHWQSHLQSTTYYYLCKDNKPAGPRQVSGLGRSFSTADLQVNEVSIKKNSPDLEVRKIRPVYELERSVQEIVRALNFTLGKNRKITEIVCDFICVSADKYVFIACRGFSFTSKTGSIAKSVHQNQGIDIRFLVNPTVVAQCGQIQYKVFNNTRSASVIGRHRDSICSDTSLVLPECRLETDTSCAGVEHELVARDVKKFDQLLQKARRCKLVLKQTTDLVQKYGGCEHFAQVLRGLRQRFYCSPEILPYFSDPLNIEGFSCKLHVLLRILKGDYHFYYKETIFKLHSRYHITKTHYKLFLSAVQGLLLEANVKKGDVDMALERLRELEPFICAK